MLNKILQRSISVLLYVVPFCVLVVSSSMYFPFITGKNFMFRILVGLMSGLWLWLIYRDKESRPKKSWILYAILAYVGILSVSTFTSGNIEKGFWSNFERMDGLVTYLHLAVYFLIATSVFRTKKQWLTWLGATTLISIAVSIYGLVQLAGGAEIHQGSFRLDASLGNSAYLATYMLFHLFILAYLYLESGKNKLLKWGIGLLALVELVVLYYTATRGAILGLLGGLFVAFLVLALVGQGKTRKVSLSIIVGLAVLVAVFFGIKDTSFVKNSPVLSRFANISLTETTTQSRFLIWNMSWQGFQEKPILGWGVESYPQVFAKYYDPVMWKQEPWFDRSHNVVFDNLINGGILGLVAYMSIFVAALYYLWRKRGEDRTMEGNVERAVLSALLAAYFFQNLFVFDNITSYILFYSILGLIHSVYVSKEDEKEKNKAIDKHSTGAANNDGLEIFVIVAAIAVTVFSVYYFSLRGIKVSQTLIETLRTPASVENLSYFKQILDRENVVGLIETREQLLQKTISAIGDKNVSDEIKQQYFVLTNEEMKRHFSSQPYDTRMRLFYGSFLHNVGDLNNAIAQLEEARKLSPKKQAILLELGSAYVDAKQVDRGVSILKEAYELDTTYFEAKRYYALVLIMVGRANEAEQLIGDDVVVINDDRFLNYYMSQRRFDRVLSIWQERFKNSPTDKQTNLSLAESYYYAGQRQKAIEVIKNFMAVNPEFKAEGENILKQLGG